MQIGKTVIVEPFLHAGDALVVDVDEADQVRDFVAGRIDALVLAQEADAGNAEAVNLQLLLRRDFTLQPDEAFLRRQALAHFAGVEIRQRRGQELDRLVLVDDAARLAEQAWRLDVGGQHLAVAVDNVGPCGRDRILRRGTARAVAVGADRKHHKPPADDRIDRRKGDHRESDAGTRLGGAVDIAAVKQAADQPLPPRFRGSLFGLCRGGHGLASGAGTEPVTEGASAFASMVPIMAPIGSGSPGLTRLGSRSGRFFSESYCVALIGFNGR